MTSGRLLTVNVATPRLVNTPGRSISTAIWKQPTAGRVTVGATNLEGDAQADLSVHGGPDKAIYAYASEDAAWWAAQLGRECPAACFGENLTTRGVDASGALVGERWLIGSSLLEVAGPRLPCFKLGLRMGDPSFPPRFAKADRPGAYLRVIEQGQVGAGDAIEVVSRPSHMVTMALMSRAFLRDHHLLPELLAAAQLSEEWRGLVADHRIN